MSGVKAHQGPVVLRAVLATIFFVFCFSISATTLAADKEYRYPPKVVGKDTVAARCVVCHSIEKGGPHRYAPNLYGIVGADKARKAGYFSYSQGLRTMDGVWTAEEIDKYLKDPQAYIPGTKKSVAVPDDGERQKIIAFLEKLAK